MDDDFEVRNEKLFYKLLKFDYSEKFQGDSDKVNIVIGKFKKNQEKVQNMIRGLFDEVKEACLQKGSI